MPQVAATRRNLNLLGALACAGALGFAFFSQYVLGYQPCHLCIFQRVGVLAMGIAFLLAAVHDPGPVGARAYAALIAATTLVTVATAGRHVWIQLQPPGSVPGCGADLDFMLDVFPLYEVVLKVFQAGGECAAVDIAFLGLSFPAWVLVFAVLVGAAGVWANLRTPPQPASDSISRS